MALDLWRRLARKLMPRLVTRRPPAPRARLNVEGLETRNLPSTMPLSVIDPGFGSTAAGASSLTRFAVSGNGQAVYSSTAPDLVSGDTNGFSDVFISTGSENKRVSTDSAGNQANGPSLGAVISANGRFVAFVSAATNLVSGDTNNTLDVFVKDLQTGATTRVSTDATGNQADGQSLNPVISADGRYVAYQSDAGNLVPGDTNGLTDVFVKDLLTGAVRRASTTGDEFQADGRCVNPVLSGDGRSVAFESASSILAAGQTPGVIQVYVKNLRNGTLSCASADSRRQTGDGDSGFASLSDDGGVIAFQSRASNLAPNTNLPPAPSLPQFDVFVRDLRQGAPRRLLTDINGVQTRTLSALPIVSGDGRSVTFLNAGLNPLLAKPSVFVKQLDSISLTERISGNLRLFAVGANGALAFQSGDSDLVRDDNNGQDDVFLANDTLGVGALLSRRSPGPPLSTTGNGGSTSTRFSLSGDGNFAVFQSSASNLVPGDVNGAADVFLVDTRTQAVRRLSPEEGGYVNPAISTNGQVVTFEKQGVLVQDLRTGVTTRLSTTGSTIPATPSLSGDGRHVAFQDGASVLVEDWRQGTRVAFGVAFDGGQANPSLNGDGRFVAFQSGLNNFVPGDVNGVTDIFVRDLLTGATTLASADSAGTQANAASLNPVISSDGRYVAFQSAASNLVPGDTNGLTDIFLKDLLTGGVTRVSTGADGTQANNLSSAASISGDGRSVAFVSFASNLVLGDGNGTPDVFIKDVQTGAVARSGPADFGSTAPSLSSDGRYASFSSSASDLADVDLNRSSDFFLTSNVSHPTVVATAGLGDGPGGRPLLVTFSKPVLKADDLTNFLLQGVGLDGVLGTVDDTATPLSVAYRARTATLSIPPFLPAGAYRLTVLGAVTDQSGVRLDGDADGSAGDSFVRDFVLHPEQALGPAATLTAVYNRQEVTADRPGAVAVGDFNNDGHLDTAVAYSFGSSGVSLLLGDGEGRLGAPVRVPSGGALPTALAVGDFDRDGNLDVAVAHSASSTVTLLRGDGLGGLGTPESYPVGGQAQGLVAADLVGNGALDLAVVSGSSLFLLRNDGVGHFASAMTLATGGHTARAVVAADFTGDHLLDLAVANAAEGTIGLLRGDGLGGFTSAVVFPSGGLSPGALAAADFDDDGVTDLAVANAGTRNVAVLLADGRGGFRPAIPTGEFFVQAPDGAQLIGGSMASDGLTEVSLTSGDFNGDGLPDLAVTQAFALLSGAEQTTTGLSSTALSRGSAARLLLGTGAGNFVAMRPFSQPGSLGAVTLAAGDFNDDGRDDLAEGLSFSQSQISTELGQPTETRRQDSGVGIGLSNGEVTWTALGVVGGPSRTVLSLKNLAYISSIDVHRSEIERRIAEDISFRVGSSSEEVSVVSYLVDNGDGTSQVVSAQTASGLRADAVPIEHAFTRPGNYTITVTPLLSDGTTGEPGEMTVAVSQILQVGDDLLIGTMPGSNVVTLSHGSVVVDVNGQQLGHFHVNGTVTVFGQNGADNTIATDAGITNSLIVYGGDGTNVLQGGGGVNALVGGRGNNTFIPGPGANLIINGIGGNAVAPGGGTVRVESPPLRAYPPVAVADHYIVLENSPLTPDAASGVLANDSDPQGEILTAVFQELPTHGSLTLNPDGSFRYVPAAGFVGSDHFSYQARNEDGLASAFTTVTIKVENAPWSASGKAVTAVAGAPFRNVLATFTDADPLARAELYSAAVTWGGTTTAGMVVANAQGGFDVVAGTTFADPGTYTVTVVVQDVQGSSVTATGSIQVTSLGVGVRRGQTQGIGFWHKRRGQALIEAVNGGAGSRLLGDWLAATAPNLFGVGAGSFNLAGKTNAEVAAFYLRVFDERGRRLGAQIMATALNVYVTTLSLGGTTATGYGFRVSEAGLGPALVSVGKNGLAFGTANRTRLNVLQLLSRADQRGGQGGLFGGNPALQRQALAMFRGVNDF